RQRPRSVVAAPGVANYPAAQGAAPLDQGGAQAQSPLTQRAQRPNVTRRVRRLAFVPHRPELGCERRADHVQGVVPLVARVEQASCRLPDLRRIIRPELARNDLVNGEMEARVDRLTADEHLAFG